MKNMKKIVAAILSLSMVGAIATTSFAATFDYTNTIEWSAVVSPAKVAPGEDVTISFYMKDITNNETITMSAGGYYGFDFSVNENFTFKSVAIGQDFGTESLAKTPVNGYYVTLMEPTEEANVTADAPIVTYVFTANANTAPGVYDVVTGWGDCSAMDGDGYEPGDYAYDTSAAKVTVGSAGLEVDKVEEETAAGITAYTVSSLAEKVIMTKTFQNVAVKPGMGLIVTNNGVTRQFGGDLYAVLGSPAEGTVTIGSLTFGLVVENTASASQFTFELR